jgi:serine kinase of HPr protein (carbohydrate metabolism regulator)
MLECDTFVHATALVIGEQGVLITGAAGAGKSSLALALIDYGHAQGIFASLVGDDRVFLHDAGGRLLARPHPAIAGQIERRGQGIVTTEFEPTACIHCVVMLIAPSPANDSLHRYPDEAQNHVMIGSVPVACLPMAAGTSPQEGVRRVIAFLSQK